MALPLLYNDATFLEFLDHELANESLGDFQYFDIQLTYGSADLTAVAETIPVQQSYTVGGCTSMLLGHALLKHCNSLPCTTMCFITLLDSAKDQVMSYEFTLGVS